MQDSDVIFEWKTHPFHDDPRRALVFCLAMVIALGAVWWSFRSTGWVLMAAVLVVGSLYRFWLPARYRVSEDELESRQGFICVRRRFSAYQRVVLEPRGAFFSPYAEPNRLEQYRGFYLPFPTDGDALRRFLERKYLRVAGGGE